LESYCAYMASRLILHVSNLLAHTIAYFGCYPARLSPTQARTGRSLPFIGHLRPFERVRRPGGTGQIWLDESTKTGFWSERITIRLPSSTQCRPKIRSTCLPLEGAKRQHPQVMRQASALHSLRALRDLHPFRVFEQAPR